MTVIIHRKHRPWQKALTNLITDVGELFHRLALDPRYLPAAEKVHKRFPLRVSLKYLARIEPGNINDPLLRQILPLEAELTESKSFSKDPLQEQQFNPLPGLLHKYQGRVLLTISGSCAIHCRYCFRRHFPYEDNNPGREGWARVIDYVAKHKEIHEIIYSGGDPLMAKDDFLNQLTQEFVAMDHIKRLRLHSRLPITLPERIDEAFLSWFGQVPLQKIMVIHCNHPQELDDEVLAKCENLHDLGVTVLNQAVLLSTINDDADTLVALCEKGFSAKILPYYLHMLDPVEGTAHFNVPLHKAKALHKELKARLPGYLVPKLVQEISGQPSKIEV